MPELNSVSFFFIEMGDTKEEALKELDEAFKFTIESALKDGIKILEPVDEDAKVRINLTIPKSVLSAIDAVQITALNGYLT